MNAVTWRWMKAEAQSRGDMEIDERRDTEAQR